MSDFNPKALARSKHRSSLTKDKNRYKKKASATGRITHLSMIRHPTHPVALTPSHVHRLPKSKTTKAANSQQCTCRRG